MPAWPRSPARLRAPASAYRRALPSLRPPIGPISISTNSSRSCTNILTPITAARSRSPRPGAPFAGSLPTPNFLCRSPIRFARPTRSWRSAAGHWVWRWPSAAARPPRICRRRVLRASRKHSSMCAANPSCCAHAVECYASLFTDRAIVYRETNGFDHLQVALSIGIQKMVRSDRAGSGVMFTLDTETGFPGVVVVNAAWGLGENVVQGTVNPDKYVIFKQLLSDEASVPDHREVARRQGEEARLRGRRQCPHAQSSTRRGASAKRWC